MTSMQTNSVWHYMIQRTWILINSIISDRVALVCLSPDGRQPDHTRVWRLQWDSILLVQNNSWCFWQYRYVVVSILIGEYQDCFRWSGQYQVLDFTVPHLILGDCLPHSYEGMYSQSAVDNLYIKLFPGHCLVWQGCLLHRHVSLCGPHYLLLPWYYFEGSNRRTVAHVYT